MSHIVREIMDILKNVKSKHQGYMCHGEYHGYSAPDYEDVEKRVRELLKAHKVIGCVADPECPSKCSDLKAAQCKKFQKSLKRFHEPTEQMENKT